MRSAGPMATSKTTNANLDDAFIENALVKVVPKIGRPGPPLGRPVSDPLDRLSCSSLIVILLSYPK